MTGERTHETGERNGSNDHRTDRSTSRRRVLRTALATGALVGVPGAIRAQSTPTPAGGAGPSAPTNLTASAPTGHDGVVLSWDGGDDPCWGSLSHYVVTRDGTAVAEVPAGVTRALVRDESSTASEFGVTAVGDDGTESATTTITASTERSDVPYTVDLELPSDSVEAGDVVTADVVLNARAGSLPEFDIFAVEVRLSTPCAATVRGATVSDAFQESSRAEVENESTAALTGGGFTGAADGSVTLGTVEIEGVTRGGTEVRVDNPLADVDDEEVLDATGTWAPLAVSGVERPAPPENVTVSQGGTNHVEISWDGVDDPCASSIDHYVVAVDGTVERTVPVGLNRTTVYLQADEYEIEVRSVDESGTTSPAVTNSASVVTADPLLLFSASDVDGPISPGETASVELSVSPGPFSDVAWMGETTVSVSSPCALSITDVTFGDGAPAEATAEVADDGASATLSPGDGTFTDAFATVEVTGGAEGASHVVASGPAGTSRNDGGGSFEAWSNVIVSADAARPPAVGDNEQAPTDPDGDGLYEDVNGNGQQEMADVVDFFQHRDSPAIRNEVDAYDFSGNEEVDLGDAVQLFTENAE